MSVLKSLCVPGDLVGILTLMGTRLLHFITVLVLAATFFALGTSCPSRPKNSGATVPAATRAIPSFGVSVPATAPDGFVQTGELWSGLYAGAVASWTIESGAAVKPLTQSTSAMRAQSLPPKVERIDLIRRLNSMHAREGRTDDFIECAINPTGSTALRPDSFGASAVERRVPHAMLLPTVRFERPDGSPSPGGDPESLFWGIIRTEAIRNGELVFVLIHSAAPSTGGTAAGKSAFDTIAAGLQFQRPVDFGQSLRREGLRRSLPGDAAFTVRMPEPFNAAGGSAEAYDLTQLWLTEKEQVQHTREGYLASLHFKVGTRDVDQRWLRNMNALLPGRAAITWRRDEPDLRVMQSVGEKDRPQDRFGYVAGRRVGGDRWVWASLELSPRAIELLGGDDGVLAVVVRTLNSVEVVGEQ